MTRERMVGFDLLYETYKGRQIHPSLFNAKLIRDTAEFMYVLGVLDGKGKLSGVKTPRGVIRRVKAVIVPLIQELEGNHDRGQQTQGIQRSVEQTQEQSPG